jgi:hypothetical protein
MANADLLAASIRLTAAFEDLVRRSGADEWTFTVTDADGELQNRLIWSTLGEQSVSLPVHLSTWSAFLDPFNTDLAALAKAVNGLAEFVDAVNDVSRAVASPSSGHERAVRKLLDGVLRKSWTVWDALTTRDHGPHFWGDSLPCTAECVVRPSLWPHTLPQQIADIVRVHSVVEAILLAPAKPQVKLPELIEAAKKARLIGKQLKLVELLALHGGRVSIPTASTEIETNGIADTLKHVKAKMKEHGWDIHRADGCVVAERTGGISQ